MLQRIDLADRVALGRRTSLESTASPSDTLVRAALDALAEAAGASRVGARRSPSGSPSRPGSAAAARTRRRRSDSRTHLEQPLPPSGLHELAAALGADVRSSSPRARSSATATDGARAARSAAGLLGRARPPGRGREGVDGRRLRRASTSAHGAVGWEERRKRSSGARGRPPSARPRRAAAQRSRLSPLADDLRALGAFRADVSGAGPAVYGLFHHRAHAGQPAVRSRRRPHLADRPNWYG